MPPEITKYTVDISDTEEVVRSNTLEVILPLDASEIRLPPRESQSDAEELYLEYLEVNEGSGYLPAMDSKLYYSVSSYCHGNITYGKIPVDN